MTPEEQAMKETEEIILKRIKANPKEIILCRQYHESMMKSSLPSKQEIEEIAEAWANRAEHPFPDKSTYKTGFKDALTLLTKGDI